MIVFTEFRKTNQIRNLKRESDIYYVLSIGRMYNIIYINLDETQLRKGVIHI